MKIRLINNLTDYLLASIICFPILQKKVEKNASECTRNHLTMPLSKCVLIIQLHELLIQIHHILMESPSPLSLWIFFCNIVKFIYRISSYSFRGNYSFLNLEIQRSQYIKVRKLFKGGNYSSAETIRGNTGY